MADDLYRVLAEKATEHAERVGLAPGWAYGFLNAMWPTIAAEQRSYTPCMCSAGENVAASVHFRPVDSG